MGGGLPTGTVTLLFTDIQGSTRLLHRLGPDEYVRALAEHRALLREAFASCGGVEVDTQGDASFVAFPTAAGAAAAARAGQQALQAGPLSVRMGLHTGTPTVTGDGYVGEDVHRGARIAALADGGQVVVSAATAALLDRTDLADLGTHRLKDFDGATRLFQLGAGAHPPLRSPGSIVLPRPATPFLGREGELFGAVSIVLEQDPRVLTVLGPGGTGKTRFAIELARLLAEYADGGTAFVPLAALRDVALVVPAIAAAVGAEGSDIEAIVSGIGGKRTHVVLDNLEQLLPEAASELMSVLTAAPDLRLILTSREAVRISGETEFELPPLPADEAAALFLATARRIRPDLPAGPVVDALCARLDRLPLAIELAAARVKLFSPEALLDRLTDHVDLLRGARDADPRHATLNATIGWSYDLLGPDEQQLFSRLGIFRGGCSLDAAEAICNADLDDVASLLDKSLLRRRSAPDGTDRFWMLETIREFAQARLRSTDDVHAAHATYYLGLAKSANLDAGRLTAVQQRPEIVLTEQDNIRAALAWCLSSGSYALGLELVTALEFFWVVHGPREGMRWAGALLEEPQIEAVDPAVLAHALRAYGTSADIAGDDGAAVELYQRSLTLFEQLGDDRGRAVLLHRLGIQAMRRGELKAAREYVESSHELMERQADPYARLWGRVQTTGTLGAICRDAGDLATACDLLTRSCELAHEAHADWWKAQASAELAAVSLTAGRTDEAERLAREALLLGSDPFVRVFAVGVLAGVAAEHGQRERAGRLWGAVAEDGAVGPLGGWRHSRPLCAPHVLAAAGPDFERGCAEGRTFTPEDAVLAALEVTDAPSVPARPSSS